MRDTIIFNGIDLSERFIIGAVDRGMPEIKATTVQNVGDGENLDKVSYGTREHVVRLYSSHVGKSCIRDFENDIYSCFYKKGVSRLEFTDDEGFYFNALVADAPKVTRFIDGAYADITFLCLDPYKYGAQRTIRITGDIPEFSASANRYASAYFYVDAEFTTNNIFHFALDENKGNEQRDTCLARLFSGVVDTRNTDKKAINEFYLGRSKSIPDDNYYAYTDYVYDLSANSVSAVSYDSTHSSNKDMIKEETYVLPLAIDNTCLTGGGYTVGYENVATNFDADIAQFSYVEKRL